MSGVREVSLGTNADTHSSFGEILHLQSEWDALVEALAGDIYLSFDWCRVWWEHYGAGRTLRVYVFRDERGIVGLLPFFIETVWIGPVWLKVAKLVGADYTTSMVNFVLRDDHAQHSLAFACDELVGKLGCDAVIFGPLADDYPCYRQLLSSLAGDEKVLIARVQVLSPYTRFPLPESYTAYMASLPKRQRSNLKRDMNLIERSFSPTQDTIASDSNLELEFMSFVEMHTAQWEAEGKLGHFHDWPGAIPFNLAMATAMAQKNRLRLYRLLSEGSVLSYQLCYLFCGRSFWRLPARLVGPEHDKFAFGRIGLAMVIESAIAEGARDVEGGAGHYEYKVKMGAEEHGLRTVTLVRNRAISRFKARLFFLLSALLHLCYYRIWFNKVAPRLPFKRKPLWKLWIRTRL